MPYTPVTVQQFKDFFRRDFPYSTDDNDLNRVGTPDITKALATAGVNFNESLWESQSTFQIAFLYLAAHFLVKSIRASSQGVNSQYSGNVTSKSVGNVSESAVLPEKIMKDPFLASVSTTEYGNQYLTLLAPRLVGQILTVQGITTP